MTKKTYFRVLKQDGSVHWQAPLYKIRCRATDSEGNQCLLMTSRVHPYCSRHTTELLSVVISESTLGPQAGFGLFAHRPGSKPGDIIFRNGQYIAPYCGEIVTDDELDERYNFLEDESPVAPYAYCGDDGVNYDGALARGPGVYANDNVDKTKINAEFEGEPHLCLVATRDIYQDEEIFVDYGEEYWKNVHIKYDVVDV